MTRDARQTIERRGSLRIAPENAHEHFRVTEVARDIHAGDGDEADDAGIFDAFSKEGRYFFSDRFGNAVRATGIVRHRWRNPSLDQQTPRSRTVWRTGRARDAVKNQAASRKKERGECRAVAVSDGPAWRSARGLRLQGASDLLGAIALDDVADFHVIEVFDGDTTLVSLLHLADVVLEAPERSDGTVVH